MTHTGRSLQGGPATQPNCPPAHPPGALPTSTACQGRAVTASSRRSFLAGCTPCRVATGRKPPSSTPEEKCPVAA
eukprot:10879629-Alexandrium_andersonii.AAC.1